MWRKHIFDTGPCSIMCHYCLRSSPELFSHFMLQLFIIWASAICSPHFFLQCVDFLFHFCPGAGVPDNGYTVKGNCCRNRIPWSVTVIRLSDPSRRLQEDKGSTCRKWTSSQKIWTLSLDSAVNPSAVAWKRLKTFHRWPLNVYVSFSTTLKLCSLTWAPFIAGCAFTTAAMQTNWNWALNT